VAPMPLIDALFLIAETREQPIHVAGLHLYDPPPDAEPDHVGRLYREAVATGSVHRKLRRRPVRPITSLGAWSWREDDAIDLEHHLRHSALPHPGRIRELLALSSRLHGTLLDRSRPMWESHIIEGLADGRFATYNKIHHSLMDGVSAMRLLERGLSKDPDERDMPPPMGEREQRPRRERSRPSPRQAASALVGAGVDGVKGIVGAGATVVQTAISTFEDQAQAIPYRAPSSPLNVPISAARRFAAEDWSIPRLRALGKQLGGTLNDVVLAMCAGALRRYLLDLGELPEQPLVAAVPVSLRADEDESGAGNAVGAILVNLGTHLESPLDRYALIHRSAEVGKIQLQGLTTPGIMLVSALNFGPLALGPLFRLEPWTRPPFNLVISNVPGPRDPLYWNGARLSGVYPASIPIHGQAMNITCTSWEDRLGFGITGCRRSVPRLQVLLEHLETSLAELEAAA
jgi:diacylglycerol O-acyltransferase / wax synthase